MLNNVLDKFKSTINTASDTLSTTVQSIAENNRNKKKLSLLKMMMKSEIKQLDRAYIALGKEYYKQLKKGGTKPADNTQKELLKDIDDRMAKITYARDCYRAIIESEIKTSGEGAAEQGSSIVNAADAVGEEAENAVAVVEEKPIAPPLVEQTPVAPPVVEQKPIAPPVVEQKPVAPPVVEQKPIAPPVVEQKPIAPPVVEQKPIAPPVVEQKPVAPPVVEQKPIAPPVVEEKPVAPAVVEEKPVSAPEGKADALRGMAAVGVAGIAAGAAQSAAGRKTKSSDDAAKGKVKKVSKDYETLKRDNRRLREALMKISKTMKAVRSADNDKK